ncbi:MAG TPA: O-acetyl-ADP-ribose deacetylase [Acidimicrobiia bacterium]|nr:O-acetyl-ADP-ribose deacetylase [Acidimicrobiia bacterium]
MTRISVTGGDITTIPVDAIVNAANRRLAGGGGVDGAIHRAGGPTILDECRRWVAANGTLDAGDAMVTGAGDLPARIVIHTAGPIWADHDEEEAHRLLGSCYTRSLDLAVENDCERIAFPNISTGVYGFPKRPAAEIAVETVRRWVGDGSKLNTVVFVCFDEENLTLYEGLLGS